MFTMTTTTEPAAINGAVGVVFVDQNGDRRWSRGELLARNAVLTFTLVDSGRSFVVLADDNGEYEVHGVLRGRYQVEIDPGEAGPEKSPWQAQQIELEVNGRSSFDVALKVLGLTESRIAAEAPPDALAFTGSRHNSSRAVLAVFALIVGLIIVRRARHRPRHGPLSQSLR